MVLSNTLPAPWLDTLTTPKCRICVSNLSFICCRLEYIKLGSPSDPTWSEFPQVLTQTQGARRYVTLFESPFVDSSLSERENNALRASSFLAVPPLSPEMRPLEGLQGTHLPEANLTHGPLMCKMWSWECGGHLARSLIVLTRTLQGFSID